MIVSDVSVSDAFSSCLPPQPCLELHLPLCPCVSPYASADPKPTAKPRLSLWAQPSTHPPCSNISDTEAYPWDPDGSEPCPGQLWPFWVLTGERHCSVSSWPTETLSSHWLLVPWGSSLSRLCMGILSLSESLFSFDECELGHLLSEPFACDLEVDCLIRPYISYICWWSMCVDSQPPSSPSTTTRLLPSTVWYSWANIGLQSLYSFASLMWFKEGSRSCNWRTSLIVCTDLPPKLNFFGDSDSSLKSRMLALFFKLLKSPAVATRVLEVKSAAWGIL